jgi:UDP-N-acetylmuramate: L-alanyl-gamma-D-glutamyl-meso-diaminopimelate ligase
MKIHVIGIGGIAMGNIAFILSQMGHTITGSDHAVYPPMSDQLKQWGLKYFEGFSSSNIQNPDLVIVGNAISRGNPEVEEVLNQSLPYISMSQAIKDFLLKGKKPIVVAGTHGKTTTSFLIHHILKELGTKPGLFAGGIRKDGAPGVEWGDGEYFVIEGDEYDTAFFDKGSKFLHYKPYILGLTALDFDHADIFENLQAVETQFSRLLKLVPGKGKVFYWGGSKSLKKITKDIKLYPIEEFETGKKNSIFSIKNNQFIESLNQTKFPSKIFGQHNLWNMELAARIAFHLFPNKKKEILSAISSYPGVKRRQDVLFEDQNTVVIEDFAHHPVAIQETIKSVKMAYPGRKIISFFEPRSATSHRNVFQDEFASSFKGSSMVYITEVFNPKKVKSNDKLDVKKLINAIPKSSKTKGIFCKDPEDLLKKFDQNSKEIQGPIVILVMSNGAFGGIYPKIVERAKKRV